jgi:hypothetical protein
MAWTDKPTDNQIFAIRRLVQWVTSTETELKMTDWLKATATRKQVSEELGRLRKLYIDRKLDKTSMFESPIWDGFER